MTVIAKKKVQEMTMIAFTFQVSAQSLQAKKYMGQQQQLYC